MSKYCDEGTVLQAKRFYADIDEAILTASGGVVQGSKTSYKEVLEGGLIFNKATSYGIDMDSLNFSNTVTNHIGRPYQDSKLLINEIMESKPPIVDPQGTSALYWEVEGSLNGSYGV